MKPQIVRKLHGFVVQLNGKELYYATLEEASARVAEYYNKQRRKRKN